MVTAGIDSNPVALGPSFLALYSMYSDPDRTVIIVRALLYYIVCGIQIRKFKNAKILTWSVKLSSQILKSDSWALDTTNSETDKQINKQGRGVRFEPKVDQIGPKWD